MRRIFWDTMLLIYLLEQHKEYSGKVVHSLITSIEKGDRLFTSWLAIGEVIAGVERVGDSSKVKQLNEVIRSRLKGWPLMVSAAQSSPTSARGE